MEAKKLEVLRRHCEAEGRAHAEIEKTTMYRFSLGSRGEGADEAVAELRRLAALGFQTVHLGVQDVHTLRPLEVIAERVIPAVAAS